LPPDLAVAAAILAAEDRREVSDDLVAATRSGDVDIRARAALALGRVGLPISYTRLLELVRDRSPEVRALAAFALGLLELDLEPATAGAIRTRIAERVIPLLEDPEPVVVSQALWTLGRQADPAATPAVMTVLSAPDRPRAVVLSALDAWWRLPGASPEPAAAHLGSPDAAVRRAAATSLRRLGDPDGLPALAAALRDADPLVRAAAIQGLHDAPLAVVDEHLVASLGDDDWRVVCAALGWVTTLWRADAEVSDDAFTAVLRASAMRNRYIQRLALEALASAPGKFSVPEDRLIFAIRSDDAAGRAAAIAAVASDDGNTADDVLNDVREVYGIGAPPRESSAAEIPASLTDSPLEAAAVVSALDAAGRGDDGWFQLLADHGPDAARAAALRRIEQRDPEAARNAAARLLSGGPPVLQAVAAEVVERLWARGVLSPGGELADWAALLWEAQRLLGEVGALEPRLTLLDTLLLVDPATVRARVAALLVDEDRVVRTWALRHARPSAGSRSAALIEAALGPQETGRTAADYRGLAERILALQASPPRLEVSTPRGSFVWELRAAWAPLSALAYEEWARSGFFSGIRFHRVVPDFVIQAGDPTSVGYGGAPGSLRNEESPIRYDAGVVGLALSGRDTGGSQFFIVQSPQPHLDGAYPVLGRVVEQARVIDRIQMGDRMELRIR
jgi:cyclophilin family peptidyl-prolyl cis-trans isomerase/HEAT repeat protein